MNTLLLVCHPAKDSLNHAVAATVRDTLAAGGHEVRYHDLYAEGFDPVLSIDELRRRFSFDEIVQEHCNDARWADLFVFVHPDWWGFAPAVLKGWLDRVFRPGIAYDYVGEEMGEKRHVGLLCRAAALVFCTTNASQRETFPVGAATVWQDSVFPFCGIRRYHVEVFSDVRNARIKTRRRWLGRAAALATEFADSSGISGGDLD